MSDEGVNWEALFSRDGANGTEPDGPGLAPPDVDLSRVWTGVAAEVWRRRPGPAERLAAWLLRSPGLARALATSPGTAGR